MTLPLTVQPLPASRPSTNRDRKFNMPQDPFQGRAPSEGGPYDNALTVTRADGEMLPVVPSAFFLPGVLSAPDESGAQSYLQIPHSVRRLAVEMQNGTEIEIMTAGFSTETGATILNPYRIRKIFWDKSPGVHAVTLLW